VAHTIHLELDLEPDRDRIAGVLSSKHRPDRSFSGWLELASAIDQARNNALPSTTAPSRQPKRARAEAP
jgi:hypothetical protein